MSIDAPFADFPPAFNLSVHRHYRIGLLGEGLRLKRTIMFRPIAAALAVVLAIPAAQAQQADPAIASVNVLNSGLIAAMRAGTAAGQSGRARLVTPAIDRSFDIPLMTRLAVGPAWTRMSAADQSGLVAAFRALTIAQYAKNFESYGGESFSVAPQVETRGGDKLVRTTLNVPKGNAESLNYRLRASGGQWKIIDVYFRNSISQLATRRSEFARPLATGGAQGLIAHLNRLANRPAAGGVR
jgi:phospholipid transport system substrate-binding protein